MFSEFLITQNIHIQQINAIAQW